MTYATYITDIKNHLRMNTKNSHTEGLLKALREAIARNDASSAEEHEELVALLSPMEKLWSSSPEIFTGGSTTF